MRYGTLPGAVLRNLSKSKLLSFRQCPKRLWLELNKPELNEDSAATTAAFRVGNEVGAVARQLYDPKGHGTLVDAQTEGFAQALERTRVLLDQSQPIFEAGFSADGAIAFADIMLPTKRKGKLAWKMVEVKSSTSVKDYHRDDAAIQAFVAKAAGVSLASISLARIDSSWVYRGENRYDGLLVEEDLTDEAFSRSADVKGWLRDAHSVAAKKTEPRKNTGAHCSTPFDCGFTAYCKGQEPQAKHSAEVLPRIGKKVRAYIDEKKVIELKLVPDELLSPLQLRVKKHTLTGKPFFDAKGAAAALEQYKLPALFLDFETISFAVPIWKGTRPYQQIPFQFSCHRLTKSGGLEHSAFLNLEGQDPSEALAQAFIVRGRAGAQEPAALLQMALDLLGLDEAGKRAIGLDRPAHHLAHQLGRVGQRAAGEALADAQARADRSPAARAGARAEIAGLQHDTLHAAVGQRACRGQAGIAAADNDDIAAGR